MIYPQKLQNYYYFVSEGGTVFDILTRNDADNCGKHIVKYETETQAVETGEYYYDETNTRVLVDGTVVTPGEKNVSTGKVDEAANSTIFPCLTITATDKDGNEVTHYLFFQFLINDGDDYKNSKFTKKHGLTDGIESYDDEIVYAVNEEVMNLVQRGYTLNDIKRTLPYWVWAQAGETVNINGSVETIVTNEFAADNFSDAKINTAILAIVKEQVIAFADSKLAPHGKKSSGLTYTVVDLD